MVANATYTVPYPYPNPCEKDAHLVDSMRRRFAIVSFDQVSWLTLTFDQVSWHRTFRTLPATHAS